MAELPSGNETNGITSYQPVVMPNDERQRQARNLFFTLLGSNFFGFFLGSLYEFLSLRGVVNIAASRIVLFLMWILGTLIAAIFLSRNTTKRKRLYSIVSSLVLAALLVLLDHVVAAISTLPIASAECSLPANSSPCQISCSINNSYPIVVRDVSVGFVGPLPSETRVYADPDRRVRLEKSQTLPEPDPEGKVAQEVTSFTIDVPIVPPHQRIQFSIWTANEDNKRACSQTLGIDHKRHVALTEIYSRATFTGAPRLETFESALLKHAALYQPRDVSCESGRRSVEFETAEEHSASEQIMQMQAQFPEWKKVMDKQGECLAPIMHFEINGGNISTMAVMVPQMAQHAFAIRKIPKGVKRGTLLEMPLIIPKKYDCTSY